MLHEEVLRLPGDDGQRLVALNPPPDSPSADAPRLLDEMTDPTHEAPDGAVSHQPARP